MWYLSIFLVDFFVFVLYKYSDCWFHVDKHSQIKTGKRENRGSPWNCQKKKNNNNNNLSLNETPIYLDLFILYNDLDDMQAFMELSLQIHFVDNGYKMTN